MRSLSRRSGFSESTLPTTENFKAGKLAYRMSFTQKQEKKGKPITTITNTRRSFAAEDRERSEQQKVLIRVSRDTLLPMTSIPVKKRHRFLFAVSLLLLGKFRGDPARASRQALISHLMAISEKFFDGETYAETISRAADAALEVERHRKNNLYRSQSGIGDFEIRV